MEATMVSEESSGSWSSSTNWITAEGSLRDSISFETSDEDAPALTSTGLLLVRPPHDDPPPCEVSILFGEKHEIHRVYVRSTAQVYEIYCSADQQNKSTECLCTVCCVAAAREVVPPGSSEGAITKSQNSFGRTIEKHEKMVSSDSDNSAEDGWVEVKVPDSPQQNDQAYALSKKVDEDSSANIQIHYEAMAEISDASPCVSLTVRLLSLQTKASLHIEEIYIYADPIDSPNPDPPVSMERNMVGNPLLAMLVPGLLQLSKSSSGRILDKYFSIDSGVRKYQYCVDKVDEQSNLDVCATGLQQTNCGMTQQNLGLLQGKTMVKPEKIQLGSGQKVTDQADQNFRPVQEQTEVKPENVDLGSSERVTDQVDRELGSVQKQTGIGPEHVQFGSGRKVTDQADQELGPVQEQTNVEPENIHLGSNQKVTDMDQVPKSVVGENNPAYNHVEKVLDELVSRMGRIEAFCSRLEENMMKHLSCIDMRLQRLEQQFDALDVGIRSSEINPSSRISAPEFSLDESDSEDKDCNTACTEGEVTLSNVSSFLVNGASAYVTESKMSPDVAVKVPEFHNEDDLSLSAGDGATSVPESNMCPGLVVKVPEFLSEDEECTDTDNTSDSSVKDCPKDMTLQSIDAASASALAAFLTSSAVESPKYSSDVMEKPHWFCNGNNNDSDSSPVSGSSGGSGKLFSKIDLKENGCEIFDVIKETNCGDSLSSADIVGAPDTSLNESHLEDKGCDASDAARDVAAFDGSSVLADGKDSSLSVLLISSLIVTAPEFPNEEGDFIECDYTSDSDVENCFKDQESVPTAGKSTLPLAAFLSLKRVKSDHNSTLSGATLGLFNGDNKKLAAPSVETRCEGVDRVSTENPGNYMKGKVDLDQIFNFLPADGGLEEGVYAKLKHQNDSTKPTVEGPATNCVPLKDGIEQKDHGVKWCGSSSTEATASDEGYFTQVPLRMAFQSKGSFNSKWHDGSWLDDSDAEEAAHSSPSFNQLSREWNEDCSMDSSFDENFIKSEVQIDWSDGSSTDSFGEPFTVNQHTGQAANNRGGSQAFVDDLSIGMALNSADLNLSANFERAYHLTQDYEDRIINVKFAPASDSGAEFPLEIWLGETCDAEVQPDVFSFQREDQSFATVNQPLLEVEDLIPSETSLWNATLQGLGINDQQPFTSLI